MDVSVSAVLCLTLRVRVKSLGADKCIDYKVGRRFFAWMKIILTAGLGGQSAGWQDRLSAATPDYADIFFNNVGGDMLDFMLSRMAMHGTVVAPSDRVHRGHEHLASLGARPLATRTRPVVRSPSTFHVLLRLCASRLPCVLITVGIDCSPLPACITSPFSSYWY